MSRSDYCLYFSDRDMPLVYCWSNPETPVITVENYCKWYTIHVVMPDGSVECPDLPYGDGDLWWHDHVPSPDFCKHAAEALVALSSKYANAHWDTQSLEMVMGRYYREVDEKMEWGCLD